MDKEKEIEYFRNKLYPIIKQANDKYEHEREVAYRNKQLQDRLLNKGKRRI